MENKSLVKKYKGRLIAVLLIAVILVVAWFAGDPLGNPGKGKSSVSDVKATEGSAVAAAADRSDSSGNGNASAGEEDGYVNDSAGKEDDGSSPIKSETGANANNVSGAPGAADENTGNAENSQGGNVSGGAKDKTPTPGQTATATPSPVPTKAPTNTPTPATSDKNDSYKHHGTTGDTYTCTIEIDCSSVLDELDDSISPKLKDIIPEDGKILKTSTIKFGEGDNVFNALCEAGILYFTDNNFIEYQYTPVYKNYYVEGIAGLYEFDFGNLSGWTYYVNGEWARVGCSQYVLKDGDHILWKYVTKYSDSDM
ncbi:MAG: DUF4430 domain-containing protein [Lachnospiraceae bacterium]|nr:DUF4430 domain-containing protein [Lachnospiraceae bacterium]